MRSDGRRYGIAGDGTRSGCTPRLALILSVLFFVAVYVWGLIWGLRSLSEPRGRYRAHQGVRVPVNNGEHVALIGRKAELDRFHHVRRQVEQGGAGYLWVTGESGCGKSRFLQACASQAMYAGWEVWRGECTEETQTDPYGPFLTMFGLCFDKGGRADQ